MNNLQTFEHFSFYKKNKDFLELSDSMKLSILMSNINNIEFEKSGYYSSLSFNFKGLYFEFRGGVGEIYRDYQQVGEIKNTKKSREFYDKATTLLYNKKEQEEKYKNQEEGLNYIEERGGLKKFLEDFIDYCYQISKKDLISRYDGGGNSNRKGGCFVYKDGFLILVDAISIDTSNSDTTSIKYSKGVLKIEKYYPLYRSYKKFEINVGHKYKKILDDLNKKIRNFYHLKNKFTKGYNKVGSGKKNKLQILTFNLFSKSTSDDNIETIKDILLELEDYGYIKTDIINNNGVFQINISLNSINKGNIVDSDIFEEIEYVCLRISDMLNRNINMNMKFKSLYEQNSIEFGFENNKFKEFKEFINLLEGVKCYLLELNFLQKGVKVG